MSTRANSTCWPKAEGGRQRERHAAQTPRPKNGSGPPKTRLRRHPHSHRPRTCADVIFNRAVRYCRVHRYRSLTLAAQKTAERTHGPGGSFCLVNSSSACASFAPSIRCPLTVSCWLAHPPSKPWCANSATTCTRYVNALGLSTRLVPHQLRHTYATQMIRSGVSFPALMTLLGQTSPDMTMRYVDVALTDLHREFDLARSQPHHLVPQPRTCLVANRTGRRHRRLALRSTCARNVPSRLARRRFTHFARPALQPPRQNPRQNPQTHHALKTGTDWPVIVGNPEVTLLPKIENLSLRVDAL